jgi:regulator of protease activity HflC (stomatin/prohibitin superfamily)
VNVLTPVLGKIGQISEGIMSDTAFIELKPVQLGLKKEAIIYEYEQGLLYRDGKFEKVLKAGKYRFSRFDNVMITRVSTRILSVVVNGQEILTKDKIGVRVSLVAVYMIDDPILAINSVESYSEQLYHDLQLALRDSVAGRDMDELLAARSELSDEMVAVVKPQAAEYGLDVKRIGVRDIVLPGQVRNVFMKEVEADREGRAELVRARHEVAAARARANTAKILTENPAMMRLQEIDALIQLASRQGNVIMLPNLADLLVSKTIPPANSNGDKA